MFGQSRASAARGEDRDDQESVQPITCLGEAGLWVADLCRHRGGPGLRCLQG